MNDVHELKVGQYKTLKGMECCLILNVEHEEI